MFMHKYYVLHVLRLYSFPALSKARNSQVQLLLVLLWVGASRGGWSLVGGGERGGVVGGGRRRRHRLRKSNLRRYSITRRVRSDACQRVADHALGAKLESIRPGPTARRGGPDGGAAVRSPSSDVCHQRRSVRRLRRLYPLQ